MIISIFLLKHHFSENTESTSTKLVRWLNVWEFHRQFIGQKSGETMSSKKRIEQIAELYNLTMEELKCGEINSILIKVHELQIENLKKKTQIGV